MSNPNNFQRNEEETCEFCKASPFVDCAIDCPCQYEMFGRALPDPIRSLITTELLKQAEFIYEKKQLDWHGGMLIERVESVMKDWPIFIGFLKVLQSLDYFKTSESVIEYLDNPTSKEKLFALWQEMGCPQVKQNPQWDLFFNAAMNIKGETNGRASIEEE